MLNYRTYNEGKKDWIVFIHGISGDMSTWDDHIDTFRKHYNLLLLDLPWHGRSKIDKHLNKHTLNCEIKKVLDVVGIQKAHFVGFSLGSIVIAQFLIKYPRYVNKAVFVASAIQASTFCNSAVRIAQPLKYILPYKLLCDIAIAMVVPQDKSRVGRKIFSDGFKRMGRQRIIEWVSYLSVVLKGKETIEKISKLGKKCLFISGEYDTFFLDGVRDSVQTIPDSELEIMKSCTHVCLSDNATLFDDRSLQFLLQ